MLRELFCRPTRTGHHFTAAVRALALEHAIGAGAAKGAFERADDGVSRVWRKIAIAAFAIGTKRQHVFSPWISRIFCLAGRLYRDALFRHDLSLAGVNRVIGRLVRSAVSRD